jgi:hypothetical protein
LVLVVACGEARTDSTHVPSSGATGGTGGVAPSGMSGHGGNGGDTSTGGGGAGPRDASVDGDPGGGTGGGVFDGGASEGAMDASGEREGTESGVVDEGPNWMYGRYGIGFHFLQNWLDETKDGGTAEWNQRPRDGSRDD